MVTIQYPLFLLLKKVILTSRKIALYSHYVNQESQMFSNYNSKYLSYKLPTFHSYECSSPFRWVIAWRISLAVSKL